MGMLDESMVPALRTALRDADFTVPAVADLLGAEAHRALMRNETTAARRATGDGSPLSTLTRLFSLQVPVSRVDADRALPGLVGLGRRVDAEHVLGISEASSSLAQLTVREKVTSALDLGTGCGVQSLHLASHSDAVVGTDVNPRALAMARLTSSLNEVEFDVRGGSLFDPLAGEKFDLIVTNPPFVVSPGTGERLVYRDSG